MLNRKYAVIAIMLFPLVASAAAQDSDLALSEAIRLVPADSQAVFAMNVRQVMGSQVYERFAAAHGEAGGRALTDFIAKTGLDPRKDLTYVIGASNEEPKSGVVIAVGTFNRAAISSFVYSKGTPTELNYRGLTVLIAPEADGNRAQRGIAFLKDSEIAVGDLVSLKAVIDATKDPSLGLNGNKTLAPLVAQVDTAGMFWFVATYPQFLAHAPGNLPLQGPATLIQSVSGTFKLTNAIQGTMTATAKDLDSATKLMQAGQGFVALGMLSGDKNPALTALMKGVGIKQDGTAIQITIDFPIDLLESLHQARQSSKKVV